MKNHLPGLSVGNLAMEALFVRLFGPMHSTHQGHLRKLGRNRNLAFECANAWTSPQPLDEERNGSVYYPSQ
jgi:hypothetical protein